MSVIGEWRQFVGDDEAHLITKMDGFVSTSLCGRRRFAGTWSKLGDKYCSRCETLLAALKREPRHPDQADKGGER